MLNRHWISGRPPTTAFAPGEKLSTASSGRFLAFWRQTTPAQIARLHSAKIDRVTQKRRLRGAACVACDMTSPP